MKTFFLPIYNLYTADLHVVHVSLGVYMNHNSTFHKRQIQKKEFSFYLPPSNIILRNEEATGETGNTGDNGGQSEGIVWCCAQNKYEQSYPGLIEGHVHHQ